ncbi:MAG: hypothetical protein AAGA56_12640 [Myxococcota bacterium]
MDSVNAETHAPEPSLLSSAAVPSGERTSKILAKTIYRELRQNGMPHPAIVAVATELLAAVAEGMRSEES